MREVESIGARRDALVKFRRNGFIIPSCLVACQLPFQDPQGCCSSIDHQKLIYSLKVRSYALLGHC